MLGGEQNLPDTPGYAAIKDRARFSRAEPRDRASAGDRESDVSKPQGNAYAAARHKRDAFS